MFESLPAVIDYQGLGCREAGKLITDKGLTASQPSSIKHLPYVE
jgi:hypothetical protein